MKIRCICIDDANRPKEIPAEKWPIKDQQYHITWIYKQYLQPGLKGVELAEFDISMCDPYNSYKANRFAIPLSELDKLIQMMKDTAEMDGINVKAFVDELVEKEELILQD